MLIAIPAIFGTASMRQRPPESGDGARVRIENTAVPGPKPLHHPG